MIQANYVKHLRTKELMKIKQPPQAQYFPLIKLLSKKIDEKRNSSANCFQALYIWFKAFNRILTLA